MCCGAKDAFVSRTVYVKRPSKRNIFPYQFTSWESQSASGHPLTWQNISRFKARLCVVNVIVLFFRFYTGFRWLFLEICFIKQNFIWDKCELQFCHGTQILVARQVFFFLSCGLYDLCFASLLHFTVNIDILALGYRLACIMKKVNLVKLPVHQFFLMKY